MDPEPTEPVVEPSEPADPVEPVDNPVDEPVTPVSDTDTGTVIKVPAVKAIRAGDNTLATTGLDVLAIAGAGAVTLLLGIGTVLAVRRLSPKE